MTTADDRGTTASRCTYRHITLWCLQPAQSQIYQRNTIRALLCTNITLCLMATSTALVKEREIMECLLTPKMEICRSNWSWPNLRHYPGVYMELKIKSEVIPLCV